MPNEFIYGQLPQLMKVKGPHQSYEHAMRVDEESCFRLSAQKPRANWLGSSKLGQKAERGAACRFTADLDAFIVKRDIQDDLSQLTNSYFLSLLPVTPYLGSCIHCHFPLKRIPTRFGNSVTSDSGSISREQFCERLSALDTLLYAHVALSSLSQTTYQTHIHCFPPAYPLR